MLFQANMAHVKKKQLICEVKSLDSNGFQYFCLQSFGKFQSVVEYNIFDFEVGSVLL